MRFMAAEAERELRTRSFMAYVTDSLHLQGKGMYRADRWAESALGSARDTRTAQEIVDQLADAGAFEVI